MDQEKNLPRTNGQGNTQLTPNLDMAVEFLKWLHPGAPWVTLVAIIPDGDTKPTRTLTPRNGALSYLPITTKKYPLHAKSDTSADGQEGRKERHCGNLVPPC